MSAAMMNIPTAFSLSYPYPYNSPNTLKPLTPIRLPLISYCLYSTTEPSTISSSSPPGNLLPPVKKKRKPYRRLRPGEAQGITEEMRFVAMKLREKKLKLETDKLDENEGSSDGEINGELDDENSGDQTWEPELDGFVRYLVDSEFVFSTVERLVDESQDVSFAYFRNSGLERSKCFSKDIEWLSTQDLTIPEPLFTSKKYVNYLEQLAAQSPPLFFCHLYNIYFSHIAGGQVIARKVSEKLLNGQELAICQWPGDPEELLKGMRDKLNALAEHWTRDEKNKCLKETSKCFMYMGTIIRLIIMR
ncbi:putative inactive heme oxygenase 2, chloroplastic [Bidens hawaiensis]|uniref:putative inactive heme oxygenase 2, chloroplastic n=1 Tax=Bidens hawaiensis TaxID=980011 RepID=UPI0040495532